MATVEQFQRREDQTKEASVCEYCHTGMEAGREVEVRLGKGDGHVWPCVAMCGHVWGQAMEMVRMAKSGGEEVCVKGVWEGFQDQ